MISFLLISSFFPFLPFEYQLCVRASVYNMLARAFAVSEISALGSGCFLCVFGEG